MKILVINGSPKGDYSTTLQTSKYLQALHPEHTFTFFNEANRIKAIEKDFSESKKLLLENDLIIFSYPVYTFLVPSQLHRFIELIKENNVDLTGKAVTQISTSKHFYDVTAHKFIEENCYDLKMNYLKGLSLDMDDLKKKPAQKQIENFFNYLMYQLEGKEVIKTNKKIAVVCDLADDDISLKEMVNRFINNCGYNCQLVNIHDFPFTGGCLNCFNCSKDGNCIYNDGFQELLNEKIQSCDGIVIGFSIKDHSMGYKFKLYDDRQFCNGHRTVTKGKPFGYLVNGALSKENNLQMVIEARSEVGGNYLTKVATNEFDQEKDINELVVKMAFALENNYTQPSNFYGVGGMKIFRDLIWLMQGVMRADYKFYKSHGQFDFPQKQYPTMLAMYLAGFMMNNKKIRKKLGNKLNDGMISGYNKVIEEAKKVKSN